MSDWPAVCHNSLAVNDDWTALVKLITSVNLPATCMSSTDQQILRFQGCVCLTVAKKRRTLNTLLCRQPTAVPTKTDGWDVMDHCKTCQRNALGDILCYCPCSWFPSAMHAGLGFPWTHSVRTGQGRCTAHFSTLDQSDYTRCKHRA